LRPDFAIIFADLAVSKNDFATFFADFANDVSDFAKKQEANVG
jgi:hypothetical protein